MRKSTTLSLAIFCIFFIFLSSCNTENNRYYSDWKFQPDRIWTGTDWWANRLQDWRIKEGKLECMNNTLPLRTVHLLTHEIGPEPGSVHIELAFEKDPSSVNKGAESWAGILIGAGEGKLDYRASALIHYSPGNAGGIIVAFNELGQVIFLDNTNNREQIGGIPDMPDITYPDSLVLSVDIIPGEEELYTIIAEALDPVKRNVISENSLTKVSSQRLQGNIAITANHIQKGYEGANYRFGQLHLEGTKISKHPQRRMGPFMGVMHTLEGNTLRLSAQLPPLGKEDDQFVRFWYRPKGDITWQQIDSVIIDTDAYIAPFKIENWNSSITYDYRLCYRVNDWKGRKKSYYYTGTIKPDPVEKEELKTGVFACISHMEGMINGNNCNYPKRLWFPHNDFVKSVKAQDPDILFFTGDQIYESRPTFKDLSSPENTRLDYLYKWYIFLWSVEELTKNTPSVYLLDDHDVYHGNIWGDNGKPSPKYPADSIYPEYYDGMTAHWSQDQGGYMLDAATVNMIQKTQTSHLPDPVDPEPVEQGIEVYFTKLNYGRVSFALLEDRKFKSAPALMLPEARVVNGFAQNRYIYGRGFDNPDAKLLGDRQLSFLEDWVLDWKDVDFKASISQTIFANVSTYPDTFRTDAGTPLLPAPAPGEFPENYRKAKDMDSNGWPQTGRNNALKTLRKGFATMLAGDQHLGSLVQMGVDRWDDAGYSFCVPAIGNLWPRRWFPPEPGRDRYDSLPAFTGKYFDGFGNRINVWAVANPVQSGKEPAALYDKAVGYGIVKFNKGDGTITYECWKRDANPSNGTEDMYEGWPKTISILDNYARTPRAWLPNYRVNGLDHRAVFQVINEADGEILYTVRIPGDTFQPGVFEYSGEYTVKIGDPDTDTYKVLEHVKSRYYKNEEIVEVGF